MTDITLGMTKKEWRIFRRALLDYTPTEEEKRRYRDLVCWIQTDWED